MIFLKGFKENEPITEWVVPAPHLENTFVGCSSGAEYPSAVVANGFDPDKTLDTLCKLYPGLPKKLLEWFVIKTAVGVSGSGFKEGDVLAVICGSKSAVLRRRSDNKFVNLWDNMDTTKFL